MLNQTLFQNSPHSRACRRCSAAARPAPKELTTRRVQLDTGVTVQTFMIPGEESVLVVQRGPRHGSRSADRNWDVQRDDVFTERATALYLPAGCDARDPRGDAASRP